MNGATAVPDVKTTRLPSRTKQRMIGKSQNFFRSFIKDQSSKRKSPIYPPSNQQTGLCESGFIDACRPLALAQSGSILFREMRCRTGVPEDAITVHVGSELAT